MGWGLDFLKSVVGEDNMKSARKVYDRTADGLGSIKDSATATADEVAKYAEQKARELEAFKAENAKTNSWEQIGQGLGNMYDDAVNSASGYVDDKVAAFENFKRANGEALASGDSPYHSAVNAVRDAAEYVGDTGSAMYNSLTGEEVPREMTEYEALVANDPGLETQLLPMIGAGAVANKGLGKIGSRAVDPRSLKTLKGDITEGIGRYNPRSRLTRRDQVIDDLNKEISIQELLGPRTGLGKTFKPANKPLSKQDKAVIEEMAKRKEASDKLFYGN